MDSSPPPADSGVPVPKSRRRLAVVAVVGCLLLVAALVGRYLLLQEAANPTPIADPPPRPRLNAPFITSPNVIVDKMVEIAQLSKDDIVFDLGCGDGRLVYELAKATDLHIIGVESDPAKVAMARAKLSAAGLYGTRVTIIQADVDSVPLPSYFANLIVSSRTVPGRTTPDRESVV